jgi:hypothetical protein
MINDTTAVEDSEPEDIEEFRRRMLRKMNDVTKEWRSCKEPICRRAKACVAQNLVCASRLPKLTPEQDARARSDLYFAAQRRVAELGGREAVEASLSAQKKTADGEESTKGQAGSRRKGSRTRLNPANNIRRQTRGRGRK